MEDLQVTYPGAGTFKFGDSAKVCTELTALVRAGKKRATCAALADFKDAPEAMPVVGRIDIAANWDGSPALVIKTVHLEEVRFCDVTEQMAAAEGFSFAKWREFHEAYFARNGGFDPEMMLIFEHFDLIEDLADR